MAGPQTFNVSRPASDNNVYNFGGADGAAAVYDGVNSAATGDSSPGNPITPRLLAAVSDPSGMIATSEAAIQQARQQIADGGEQQARLQTALDTQKRQMANLNQFNLGNLGITSKASLAATTQAYNAIASEDIQDRAHTAVEREAVGRIQDDMRTNNPVEARLTYQLNFGTGDETKVWHDEAVKNLLLAQKIAQYEGEHADESWGRAIYNTLTSFIPTNYNFSRSGVVPGAEGGFKNWLLSGTGLASQGETMWNRYRDPTEFAKALKDGGELDQSIRANSTTLGGYDPETAADLLQGLAYSSASDRAWSNLWGVVDPASVMPWTKITSVPGALTRLGSRSAARNVVADAVEQIAARGPAGAEVSGVTAKEAVEHLETTAMNPGASTASSVPLSTDVDTRLAAAKQALNDLPTLSQVSRASNPDEIMAAFEARTKSLEAELGRPIKDVEYATENVQTGERSVWKPGDQLPENGNHILTVDVTIGKKDGGGFATAKGALGEVFTKMGLTGDVIEDTVTREFKELDPEFNITGFHGTAAEFDKFSDEFAGKLTDAKSAKMATFATNNPDVAWTYAVEAAKDRAISLPEMIAASAEANVSRRDLRSLKNELGEKYGLKRDPYAQAPFDPEDKTPWGYDHLDESHLPHNTEDADLDRFFKAQDRVSKADQEYSRLRSETSISGQNIRPVKIRMRNPYIHDFADQLSNSYDERAYSAIIERAKADGHDGVILRNTDDAMGAHPEMIGGSRGAEHIADDRMEAFRNHDIYAVFDNNNIVSPWDAVTVKRDVSGQFFGKARFNVPLEGFTTTPMNTPDNGLFRFARSAARRLDRDAQVKAVAAGASGTQLENALKAELKNSLKGISATDHGRLDEIVRSGQNKSVWFEDSDLDMIWDRLTGNGVMPERVRNAYRTYQRTNDMDFILRRNELYKLDANAGRENVSFDLGKTGIRIDGPAKVSIGGNKPTERVFNASDNIHYNSKNPLTDAEWERLNGEGYLLTTLKEGAVFPDGTRLRQVLVRRGELERAPLSLEKTLGYKAGGHRAYTGKYYAKQAVIGAQPDNGAEYLMNPNVFRTGNNKNRLAAWAERFNKAIDAHVDGMRDPVHFDENIFANFEGLSFPTGEEFLKAVEDGRIATNHHVEIVGDRELPKAYSAARDDADRFLDDSEGGVGGYMRTTGRMYTSAKGDALLDESGEFAATVDPWQTTDRAISNITRMTSFSNYKDNVLERFKSTYGKYLKLRQLEDATPQEMMKASVRDDVPPELRRRITAEQNGFATIMGHETEYEKRVRSRTRELAEWVLGDAKGGAREMAHDFVYWLSKNNPVNYLRGIAFDTKLGMFNIGQFALQATTMAASTALSPRHGFKGMFGSVPMFLYVQSAGKDSVLDLLAKRGVWRTAGFESEEEFKDFARFGYKTGFFDVNKTHLSINDMRPSRYFGATSALDNIREMGRTFFYKAEIMNRSVAGRIAWEELKERGVRPGTAAFREQFVGLADDYSMNMMHESGASFQHGLTSLPTQFWGYNVRMMDAMFGSRFTPRQRAQLILSQLALYGAGGVPVLDAINDFYRMKTGDDAKAGSVESFIDRGMLDNAIAAISGADVRIGERVGSGTFLTDLAKNTGVASAVNAAAHPFIGDVFNVPEYAKLTPFEFAGGATYSISSALGKTLTDVVRYAQAEGGIDGPITRENLLKVADNVSTFANFHKAYLASNYGMYKSQTGTISGTNLPPEDALWFALGLGRPQEADTAEFQNAAVHGRETMIKEAATVVRNWRQEAFTRPDVMNENAEKVNTLLKMYPSDIRQEIIKRTNKITDKSFYDYVQHKYDSEFPDAKQQDEANN